MKLTNGPLFIDDAGSGIIMKRLKGNCYRLSIDSSGVLQPAVIPCPQNQ